MRAFMRPVALVVVMLTLLAQVAAAGPPKNFILLIGDGMGVEQVKAANYYNGGDLFMETLPYQAVCTTRSADNSVTDSAASATAIATGYKVNNYVISQAIPANVDYPLYGSAMETLLEYYKARGKSTGLVSTAYITHATPAAFGAHEPSRGNTTQIATDYMTQSKPNVLLGGGGNGMSSGAASTAGYSVVTTAAGMLALNTSIETVVSGQFGSGHMNYEADGVGTQPHLSEMTTTALNILDNDSDGFFLMVEGGRIDHAGHDKLIHKNVAETIEFDNTVEAAMTWAAGRTDTLILVTADHETGGLSVLGDNGEGNLPTVSWSSTGHTSANVPVYAWGVNASMVSGTMDNTDFFEIGTVPEPSSIIMVCMAIAGLLGYGRRRRS
jgi:alkaline phosphatase